MLQVAVDSSQRLTSSSLPIEARWMPGSCCSIGRYCPGSGFGDARRTTHADTRRFLDKPEFGVSVSKRANLFANGDDFPTQCAKVDVGSSTASKRCCLSDPKLETLTAPWSDQEILNANADAIAD